MPLALLALTLSAFAIGTTEFVIVGLIPTIAADLGVSLPSAGLVVLVAVALTAWSGRLDRNNPELDMSGGATLVVGH